MKLREIIGYAILGVFSLIYDWLLFVYQSFIFGNRIWWWRLNLYYSLEYLLGFHWIANREAQTLPFAKDNFICGETPCITLKKILRSLKLEPDDIFIDLGCGRGQTVFFSRLLFGLKAQGYDLVSTFINKARLINCFLKIDRVEFFHDNLLNADLRAAKVVYIVPTTFTQDFLGQVYIKLREVPPGSFVISVSRPLRKEDFELFKTDTLLYSWGKSTVYYYIRRESEAF